MNGLSGVIKMDLRAFLNIKFGITFRLFFAGFVIMFGVHSEVKSQPVAIEPKTPYEIRFVDVTFQLSDVARYLLSQEIAYLDKNPHIKQDYLEKLSLYLPVIDPMIRNAGVPEDFKFLSVYSKFQKSVGLVSLLEPGIFWCMDNAKALDVDLEINHIVDERKHLTLATAGALVSLKRNNILYNSWGSALFAHIADRSVIKTLDIGKKWNGNKFIVLDSPAYSSLIHFLAFKWVMERDWPGFRPEVHRIVYEYPYGKGKSLNLIGADLQVEPKDLVESNKWLKVNLVPDRKSTVIVVIPSSRYHEIRKLSELSRNLGISGYESGFPVLKETPAYSKGKGGVFYKINDKKGIRADFCDSHVTLAYKSDLSLKKFLDYNEMTEKDVTTVGQVYYLQEKNGKAKIPFHIVKEGETIWYISQLYGVKMSTLLDFNRMDAVQRLQHGRVIWLQKKRSKKRPVEHVELPKEEITFPEEEVVAAAEQEQVIPVEKLVSEAQKPAEVKPVEQKTAEQKAIEVVKETPKEVKPVEKPKTEETVTVIKQEPKKEVKPTVAEKKPEPKKVIEEDIPGSEISDGYIYHIVKQGETLYRISVNYKVSVEKLYKLNNLKSNTIEIGDRIRVKPI